MTKRKSTRTNLSPWQTSFLNDLRTLAAQQPHDLRITDQPTTTSEGRVSIRLRLFIAGLPMEEAGLPLKDEEDFLVIVSGDPLEAPIVEVEHDRFVGHPHVLQGRRLCLYLDQSREWDPVGGITAFLNRFWQWLTDASEGRFNASTAIYHAVGGVLHRTSGTPTIVVRQSGVGRHIQLGWLKPRSSHRLDLISGGRGEDRMRAPVLTAGAYMPYGAGATLAELLALLTAQPTGGEMPSSSSLAEPSTAFLTALAASAAKSPHDSPQYFVLAVPHPAGGPDYLLGGRLTPPTANLLRHKVKQHGVGSTIFGAGDLATPIEWCMVSDERPAVTTRRDNGRPVSTFCGKNVHIWGCGGIGSWAAEFIARAGATRITLCDPGNITGGLLIRQNYTETDIGSTKADALARRLNAISDGLKVEVMPWLSLDEAARAVKVADVVIDATVNLAVGRLLDTLADNPDRRAVLAQFATDARTGSLGIVTVSVLGNRVGPSTIDRQIGPVVLGDPRMELYHSLWQEPLEDDELVPTRGCSVPTFHGSAADMAAVAGSLVTFLGTHLRAAQVSGTHLCAVPHAHGGPAHRFLPHS
ncbi:ThiF family adenylyltransferase [Streptomyces hainanensis]|uniref:Thiamine biosynthesis protein ThiF n=1 Tax=Streptomyces hainanensis TaxID=402648 RepID=A0A4R4T3E8_9ACTN|nr:ThiF family adenylyltransferase [Streptomyces hainanensis]TDC71428.1 thiamine biosynthesis protein ThiF [Streptomyces hainanensis]